MQVQKTDPQVGTSFRFTLAELSGALADLGVMLPLALALISLNGMDPSAVFIGIGLAYFITAFTYRLPIPVQPLKSFSAVALSLGLTPVIIVSGAIWNGLAFLGMGAFGLDRWAKLAFPKPVVRGIQLGLAFLLIKSAWTLVNTHSNWPETLTVWNRVINWNFLLAAGAFLILLSLLKFQKSWAALGVFAFGIGMGSWQTGIPALPVHLSLPSVFPLVPNWNQLWQGLVLLALPQIPLSLGNSVYATADAARQYFGERAAPVTEKRLMLSMGINDLLAAALAGIPVCHGCGGLTAHFRLGARTGGAPVMLGIFFVLLGLLGSQSVVVLTNMVPLSVLGVLLAFVAFQHALLARDLRSTHAWLTALLVLALTILTGNLAISFICAAGFYYIWGWLAPRIPKPC